MPRPKMLGNMLGGRRMRRPYHEIEFIWEGFAMPFDRDIHRRHSIRLPGYNYAGVGMYFVTICTKDRECLFGEIVGGEMRLNDMGSVADTCLQDISAHFPYVDLDAYIVMPNHVHVILMLNQDNDLHVGATHASPENCGPCDRRATHASPLRCGPKPQSIGAIIGSFKAAVTKSINQARRTPGLPVWQRNYYERVVRDDNELRALCEYITNNPMRWAMDADNPVKLV